MAGKQLFIFLVEEIMEKGYGKLYYLGQNKNNNLKSDKLKNYYILQKIEEVEDKNFTFIFCKDENAAAITTEGELYTFGNNNENELSHFCYAPKKIENLNDYICDNVSLSDSHMVVIARKKDTGKKVVLSCGDNKYEPSYDEIKDLKDIELKEDKFLSDKKDNEEPIKASLSNMKIHLMSIKVDLTDNNNRILNEFKCVKCSKYNQYCVYFKLEENKKINYYCDKCITEDTKQIYYVLNTIENDTKKKYRIIIK